MNSFDRTPIRKYVLILMVVMAGFACNNNSTSNNKGNKGVEAKDALATYKVADGFKIEMIASEPLISDPVDMEIDEYGRMYVVEMHGYPLDKSGSGKIILLTDTDGDGNMDKRTVFKDGLVLPNSIMRWKKGVLVTDAPAVLYLEDTDGDGVADITDTMITGFALSNPQHNVNNPVYGLDNWIYIAHEGVVSTREYKKEFGDKGSEIYFANHPEANKLPDNANGRSIRMRPDKMLLEMSSSSCQFGQTFDQWGHLFGCNNSNQGYQEVIADRYFQRNHDLLISDATQNMSDHLNAAEVFPITTNPDRQLLTNVGVMTSACGLTDYMGDLFPAPYNKHVTFVAEPVSNLVHVDILKDSGASFTASRILQEKEFLSSTDSWARPVNFYVGPDGALYVLDYYRKVIESPEWMSEEAIKAGGLYDGYDKGRIFRITPTNTKKAEWTKGLKLGDASSEELVKYLANKNNWWRMNAQRLLVDRADKNAIPALVTMTTDASEDGRLHSLWTLEGMGELKSEQINKALKDSVAGIRENAIKLAELHLNADPALATSLLALQNDKDAKVRFQLLLTLGFVNTPQSSIARTKLLLDDINDKWVQIAALSASSSQTLDLLKVVMDKFKADVPAYASLVERLTTMVGSAGRVEDIHQLLVTALTQASPGQPEKKAAIIQGLAQGLKSRKISVELQKSDQQLLVNSFFQNPSADIRHASLELLKVNNISDVSRKDAAIREAASVMNDSVQPDSRRAEAIYFLALGDPGVYTEDLKKFINPKEEPPLQLAALYTLSRVKGTAVSEYSIQQWEVLTPEIREASINTFLSDSNRIALLIDALEKNKIKPSSIKFSTSVRLMDQSNENLRNRARVIFTKNERERVNVNKEYEKALQLDGDAAKGKQVYMTNCAICHQVRGKMGVAFGPDLGTVQNWIKEDVMANILNPNLSISSGFDMWNVQLNSGETEQGIIFTETPVAITLRNNGKMDRTINRQDIQSIRAMNASAMPTGLEKNIDKQQMADLLAFLRRNQDFK
jgi:putative membrane-bound dehydrogenase-like protein